MHLRHYTLVDGDRPRGVWPAPLCRRRPLHAVWRCQIGPQVVPAPVDPSLPSYSFKVTAKQAASKLRLDTYLAVQIAADLATSPTSPQDVSRAKVQASISSGLVLVNGRPVSKASYQLRAGDVVLCSLPPPPPLQAVPEDIPLDIRYEDEHLLVINKPAGMVVHVAPGHHSGTLVNALLHHCALPAMSLEPTLSDGADEDVDDDGDDDDPESDPDRDPGLDSRSDQKCLDLGVNQNSSNVSHSSDGGSSVLTLRHLDARDSNSGSSDGSSSGAPGSSRGGSISGSSSSIFGSSGAGGSSILRPGIVHRLDKGTSGLLVVAKTEVALTRLQAQFKARTVDRLYVSVTVGYPAQPQGRVEANIVRDPRDRKRMAAAPYGSGRGRTAASTFRVQRSLAGGGAALVQWKLDTGRTHQIRVHAKHIGHPLLGDETYGGAGTAVAAAISRSYPADKVRLCMQQLGRPALHALTLGFTHPVSGQRLAFEQPSPEDFTRVVEQLGG